MKRYGSILMLAAALAAQQPNVATIVAFTEGPAVDAQGNVYFTETTFSRIMKWTPGKQVTVFRENSNAANGLAFDAQGRLVACESGREGPRVTRTDMKTGKLDVLASGFEGGKFTAPNDVTIDDKGRIFFTDLPGGAVYRIDADGKLSRILNRPDIQRPNGIMISPDEKTLYLVEANQQKDGARMIRAYDLQADGSVRNMRVFHNFYPGRSADGICIDSQGNLHAAAGLNRTRGTSETLDTKAGVHVFSPQGKLLKLIAVPEDTITNCAFGGPDMKTLYVTAGKTLFEFKVDVAGTRR
jgi:gluconolactonase